MLGWVCVVGDGLASGRDYGAIVDTSVVNVAVIEVITIIEIGYSLSSNLITTNIRASISICIEIRISIGIICISNSLPTSNPTPTISLHITQICIPRRI